MNTLNKLDEAIKKLIPKVKLTKQQIIKVGKEILKKNKPRDFVLRVDDQIFNYVDSDWKLDGEYESEYDWYQDFGRGEVEDDVIDNVVREYESKNHLEFNIDTFVDVGKYVANKATSLTVKEEK